MVLAGRLQFLFRSIRERRPPLPIPTIKRHPYSTPNNAASERMVIGFTCKVCNQRTHRTMSKTAYTRGVVLIECPGCNNRHLIADNLGWFDRGKETRNIEEIMAARGEAVQKVTQEQELFEILKEQEK